MTIGAFDGVHLGHQAVLRLVRELAAGRGLSATVLTFDRHPAEVVRPGSAPKLLTTLDQKLELLEATGAVDECLVLPFDASRSKEPAEQFVEELLASALRARLVVVGADFHFGYRRHGDVPLLQLMGAELGFETIGLGLVAAPDRDTRRPVLVDPHPRADRGRRRRGRGARCSVVRTRCADRSNGAMPGAGELGFPTANVSVAENICLPADGVYAGTFTGADGVARRAAISVGPPAHVLRRCGDVPARGVRPRLRRRSLRPGGPGPVHAPHPGPGTLRRRRRPDRPDASATSSGSATLQPGSE